MSKTIKLDDTVHQQLEGLRYKRETFSEVVERLIKFYQGVRQLVWSNYVEIIQTPGRRA